MMDVIIVVDEPAARRTLKEFCDGEPDLRVIGEYGDGRSALAAIRSQPPHLLFLDIQMDTMTGLELARSLDPETLPLIVFVTAYDQFALDAFEVRAVDYLLKPFDEERLRRTVAQVRQRREKESAGDRQAALASLLEQLGRHTQTLADARPRFVAEREGRMLMLEATQVEVVEGDRNYVKLTVGRDVYHARSTLQQAEV